MQINYKIIVCPDPLPDEALIDHPQRTIWIDPRVSKERLPSLAAFAVRQALQEMLALTAAAR